MKPLTNRTILLTSGPTYAFIDAVRVISNRSSGRLGSTIASTLVQSGAHVIQLSGELSVSAVICIRIRTPACLKFIATEPWNS
ncbi:MAG: phosphopantothenoylcysteine decarboxylase [bacterium]